MKRRPAKSKQKAKPRAVAGQTVARKATAKAASKTAALAARKYKAMVERLRQTILQHVPADATVAVISRGDESLLQFDGRTGWHFPREADGQWMGYHPGDSDAAVSHLESIRAAGAKYLLLPQTAAWWLDHYEGFRQHLDAHYSIVESGKDGALYHLANRHEIEAAQNNERLAVAQHEIESLRGSVQNLEDRLANEATVNEEYQLAQDERLTQIETRLESIVEMLERFSPNDAKRDVVEENSDQESIEERLAESDMRRAELALLFDRWVRHEVADREELENRLASIDQSADSSEKLSTQIAALEKRIQRLGNSLDARVGELSESSQSLSKHVDAFGSRLDYVAESTQNWLKEVTALATAAAEKVNRQTRVEQVIGAVNAASQTLPFPRVIGADVQAPTASKPGAVRISTPTTSSSASQTSAASSAASTQSKPGSNGNNTGLQADSVTL